MAVCPICGAERSTAGLCARCLLTTALSDDEADETATLLAPGTMIGPFRIVRLLGRGGMATVYEAQDASLDRAVALKLLPAQFVYDEAFARRFEREARVVARLEHPNIVPIYATGIDNGTPWMSMRLLAGGSLAEIVAGRPARQDVIRMLRQVALALDYAHSHGIVHRDIKPTNLLVDDGGGVSVADFGLAQILGADAARTQSGVFAGTPHYMAPEQALGGALDHRCDIYSLGIVAYEMLVGEAPFSGESPVAVMFKQVHDALPDVPRDVAPPAVMRVIRTAAAKQPASRFSSASAFVDALDAAMADAGGPRRLQGRVAAAAAVLLIGAAGAWLVQGRNSGPMPQPATSGGPTRDGDVVLLAPMPASPPDASPPTRPATVGVARPLKRSAAPPTVAAMPDAAPPRDPLPATVSPQSVGSTSAEPREAPEPVSSAAPPPDAAADEVTPPVRIRAVEPVYPPLARAAQLEGDVVLQVVVGRDGKVSDIAVVVSIHPLLDEAARNAVRRYEYLPARRNGVPEARTIRIAVSFRMR
jgi:eukaryotic-like serine/threonine-protein kinase